jgi:hypothetical protein
MRDSAGELLRHPIGHEGFPHMVKVPVEIAVIHQDLEALINAVRDLVQVTKGIQSRLDTAWSNRWYCFWRREVKP